MCKTRPGIRCSDHSAQKLLSYYQRKEKLEAQLKELSMKEGDAVDARDASRFIVEREKLEGKLVRLNRVIEFEQLDYDATPKGQAALEERIAAETDEDVKELLETDLVVAKKRRLWQSLAGRRFRKLDKDTTIEGQQESLRKAQLEKDAALAEAAELRKKIKKMEKKKSQLPAKSKFSPDAHKVLSQRIQKTLKMAQKMYSLYMLIAFDMDGFISRKAQAITVGLVSKTAASVGSFGIKPPKPLKLEDFLESVEEDEDGNVLYRKYDTESILRRLNEPSNRRR